MNPYTIIKGTTSFGTIATTNIWLPSLLKEIGVINSTSQLKKNRPDLWREIIIQSEGDIVKIGRRCLRVYHVDHIIEVENPSKPNLWKIMNYQYGEEVCMKIIVVNKGETDASK